MHGSGGGAGMNIGVGRTGAAAGRALGRGGGGGAALGAFAAGGVGEATVGELLSEFPLGAGVGRWGMMNVYFGNPAAFRAAPIYVEIQLTGWLIDGGIPMWLLYGGAVLLGINGVCIKAHGASSPKAIKNAIRIATELVEAHFNEHIVEDIKRFNDKLQQTTTAQPTVEAAN